MMGWGKGNKEPENWEGKTILQIFGVNKEDEWIDRQDTETVELLNKNIDPLDTFISQLLQDRNFIAFGIVVKLNGLEKQLQFILQKFFQLGYMTGKVEQEQLDKLESIFNLADGEAGS